MKLLLDKTAFNKKPKGFEIGAISKRIVKSPVDINVKNLAKELGSGKTFVPATFKKKGGELKRSIENWESQQIIGLDFDEGLSLEEAYNDKFLIENAAFLYTTFSHTVSHHKFRVIFVLDKQITDYKKFQVVIGELLSRYPQADKSCKDGSRLFFGGLRVTPFNYNNRLVIDKFVGDTRLQDIENNLSYMSVRGVKSPERNYIQHASNINMIRNRNIKLLQEKLNAKPITLSKNEVISYLKKQDLRLFLGIEGSGNFKDIFHEETNPSASIYQSNKGNGHWLYKCFSESHPFVGTLLHIVEKLLHTNTINARNFLMEVYKISVHESEAVKELRESIDIYKEFLRSEELGEIHPNFYKVFNRYGHLQDLYILLDLTKEYITNDTDPRIVFFHSIRTLAKHFNRSIPATGTRLNFLTLFKVTQKLDENKIPQELLEIQESNKRKNKYKYRNSTYEIPIYTYELFTEIDEMCRLWLEKGCTSRTISYEGVLRTFGRIEADRVYPQDKGKKISELNEDIVSSITETTLRIIEFKGWTIESEVLDCMSQIWKINKDFKMVQFKRCIAELLDAYDLEIIASNKKVKMDMGITEDLMSKQSFPKIIRRKI